MKIPGQSVIKKVISKVIKSPEAKNKVANEAAENSGKIIYLKDRKAAVDSFYKQVEKVKKQSPSIYLDDEAPIRTKPFASSKYGYFDRHI